MKKTYESVAKEASQAGLMLRLDQTPSGFEITWAHISGMVFDTLTTNAADKAGALKIALQNTPRIVR